MSARCEQIGKATLWLGDCREALAQMPEASVDACVTDPPYHLMSGNLTVDWACIAPGGNGSAKGPTNHRGRGHKTSGFMGKQWDGGDVAFRPETWAAVLRVLKPGAHLLAFGGTRTYHRLVCAIEDAGFEIRDQIAWLYGSGFPKSYNLSGDWHGWGTALKPAHEPIVLARKPLQGTVAANVLAHGTGAINVDGCRIDAGERLSATGGMASKSTPVFGTFNGSLAKPITTTLGRWPANVAHDGSPEVLEAFARFGERSSPATYTRTARAEGEWLHAKEAGTTQAGFGDTGSAARFFFSGKATAEDRIGSRHPTVKPIALMRWLVRLITPPSGTVLDPFAGSGTTLMAALAEGFHPIGIELEAQSHADCRHRLAHIEGADTPLFAEAMAL